METFCVATKAAGRGAQVAGKHPRLVRQPAAVVGPPHPGLVRHAGRRAARRAWRPQRAHGPLGGRGRRGRRGGRRGRALPRARGRARAGARPAAGPPFSTLSP